MTYNNNRIKQFFKSITCYYCIIIIIRTFTKQWVQFDWVDVVRLCLLSTSVGIVISTIREEDDDSPNLP